MADPSAGSKLLILWDIENAHPPAAGSPLGQDVCADVLLKFGWKAMLASLVASRLDAVRGEGASLDYPPASGERLLAADPIWTTLPKENWVRSSAL
jgi:hypothetical protein